MKRITTFEMVEKLSRTTIRTKTGETIMDMPTLSMIQMYILQSNSHLDFSKVDVFVDDKKQLMWVDVPDAEENDK